MKTNSSINESSHAAVDRMAAGAHHVVDGVADAANTATDNISDKTQQLRAIEERWVENVRDYVQGNPVSSIAIAVAGGYLVSRIFSRR